MGQYKGMCGPMRAKAILNGAGLEERQMAERDFVLGGPTTGDHLGILVLHVVGACFPGEGALWEDALKYSCPQFTLGTEEYGVVTDLGRNALSER